jgi:hypothetical protein
MRKVFAMLALLVSALWAAPTLAAPSTTLDLAAWVKSNTDLAMSQIAIAGPENVYSLEPLGPRLPTGEVLALVRTEAVSTDWRGAHQFQSWDAHLLFDCQGGRVRVLRSASYQDHDRRGAAKADERGGDWFKPEAHAPAATLLAAACNADFDWPLRANPAIAPEPVRHSVPPLTKIALVAPPGPVEQMTPLIRTVSFVETPSMRARAFAAPEIVSAHRPARMFATARRLATVGRSWLAHRFEIALRPSDPSHAEPGPMRQAQAS